ncbi:serine-threonine/tyrosine-protein kinase catalytic domain-containing protein, partial [Tanacetum coccineum]
MSKVNKWQHLKIPFKVIEVATENFKTLIGRGGYGSVYKGKLLVSGKETMVAVKRLNERYGQGLKEFLTEIDLLSGQHHPNLVSLVGYCDEGKEKTIVYEYAERGSLDQYIRRSGKSTSTSLTWLQRLKICADAARGLDHLHRHVGGHRTIIHRDIKSSNILIDENWVGKISDLGLSKLSVSGFGMSDIVSNGCGTKGYCEPEYFTTGVVTKKSDVFSFGIVLFEVLCGRLCLIDCDDRFSLSSISAEEHYKNNSLDKIIDHSLEEHIGSNSMTKFAEIAYRCLHSDREQRPTMDVVVKELEEALSILVKDELVMNILKEFEEKCATDLNKLKQIGHAMCVEMHAGLASEGGSKLKMLISHVDKLPTGDEEGVHYALHLGSTLFRILRVQLGGKSAIEDQESLEGFIPPEFMVGTLEPLFDYIAAQLADFLADESHKFVRRRVGRQRELGFTFSFPVMHLSIDSGTLIQWTKGFSIEEM